MTCCDVWYNMAMENAAKDILDRLLSEYADDREAVELIRDSYDEILSYEPDRALLLARQAEHTLSVYY